MWDYYGLPTDFPGRKSQVSRDIYNTISAIENAFQIDINESNFIPNLIVHEFEGLLFSDLSAFSSLTSEKTITELREQAEKFLSPEHINDNRETAPSKRILKHFPKYQKVFHGPLISSKIGMDTIRKKCRHFNNWLEILEVLEKR